MSSGLLERCPVAGSPRTDVRELLVLWQHPESHEIIAIGRFDYDGENYDFAYTRWASKITGFRPLPGLPLLEGRFRSPKMPAVFNQRVMSVERSDFNDYLRNLGLSAQATPWEQIVESGGHRAGDTLQFMDLPQVVGGRATARFLASGVRHIPEQEVRPNGRVLRVSPSEQEGALASLQPGSTVALEAESDNPHDPAAVLITVDGVPLGWVPRILAPSVRRLMAAGTDSVYVHRVADISAPAHLRLSLDLDTGAPEGFLFDPEGRWERFVA